MSDADTLASPRLFSPLILWCLAATWLIWGSTYLVIRFALVGFSPFFLMATRFICAGSLLCGGFALLAMSALAGESWIWPTQTSAWVAWLYLVVFGSLIAFNAYMLLLARTQASLAASYSLVNPVVALFLGVTWGGETVSTWEWVASGVVMIGVVLLFLGRRKVNLSWLRLRRRLGEANE
jgi:drug/metabolite transporter (DMT)-like permease